MQVIGLTGGSGAGKSVVSSFFQKHGIPVIDADGVYHEILAKGGDCTAELAAAFGTAILDEQGLVSRAALASAVFGKPDTEALLHTLNTITHKYVMSEIKKRLHALKLGGEGVAVIDAPLLFEANAHLECDFVIGLIAEREVRIGRIMARDRISRESAEKRVNAQKSDAFFRERCDYILENNTDAQDLEQALLSLLIQTGVIVE